MDRPDSRAPIPQCSTPACVVPREAGLQPRSGRSQYRRPRPLQRYGRRSLPLPAPIKARDSYALMFNLVISVYLIDTSCIELRVSSIFHSPIWANLFDSDSSYEIYK